MERTKLGQISTVHFILFGAAAASPTLAALTTVLLFEKSAGLKAFFRACFLPKLNGFPALFSVMLAPVILLTAKAVSCLLLKTPFTVASLSLQQCIIIAWAFLAEEPGWRGFLTSKLTPVTGQLTPLFVGLVWALWHYHFFILGTITAPVPLFVAGCVADSYLYASLLQISGGNLFAAMLFHMASNFFLNLFLISPNVKGGSSVSYAAYVMVSALFAIVLSKVLTHRRQAKGAPSQPH